MHSREISTQNVLDEANTFNYSYGRYFSNGVLVLTSIMLLVGLKLISLGFEENILFVIPGIILSVLGIASYLPEELFQINYITNEYRSSIKVGKHIWGEWKKLGDVKYLSIIHTHKAIHLKYEVDPENPKRDVIRECRLRLFKKAGYTIEIDDFKNKESAVYIGRVIAKAMKLQLLDATEKPAVFLDL